MWVEMRIEPGYNKVGLVIGVGEHRLADLELRGVRSVTIDRRSGREWLRIELPEQNPVGETLWLETKPDISLRWASVPRL